jgi:hypothetical protein
VQSSHDAQIGFVSAKRHHHTTPNTYRHALRHSIGEHPLQGYGQYEVSVLHRSAKIVIIMEKSKFNEGFHIEST